MKKFSSIYLSLFILSWFLVASCKDEDVKTKTELLTAKSWIITKIENVGSGTSVDVTIEDCKKDDIEVFTTDKVYTHKFGTMCVYGQVDYSGTWEFTDGEKNLSLTLNRDIIPVVYKLISLSEDTMVLQHTGINFRFTYTGK